MPHFHHRRTVVMAALSLAAVLGLARMADSRNEWFRAWEGECAAREAREAELGARVKALEEELAAERRRAAGLESEIARVGEEEHVEDLRPTQEGGLRKNYVAAAPRVRAAAGEYRAVIGERIGLTADAPQNGAPVATYRIAGCKEAESVVIAETLTKLIEVESNLQNSTIWIGEAVQFEDAQLTFVSGGVTLRLCEEPGKLNQGVDYVNPATGNGIPEPARAGGLNQGVDYVEPPVEKSGLNQGQDYVDPADAGTVKNW